MKRFISIMICVLMLLSNMCALAYNYPSNFWNINAKYETALNTNDHKKIIDYGNQIIELMQTATDGSEKRNILVTRYNQVGISYAALEDYDNAAKTYNTLYDYASQYGDEFYDYVKASKARMLQYTSEIKMYTSGGESPYYGAINEKKNGIFRLG